jgi:ribosomal protein L30E
VVDASNPYVADVVIGSDLGGGIRHDPSMMWFSSASASRISNTGDVFYLSRWSTTIPNIGLSAFVGGSSYFKGNVGIGTTTPSTPLHLAVPSAALTDIPMQKWDPAVSGYNLVLSNYNGVHGVDYRFTQLANGSPIPVLTFQGGNVGIGTVNPDAKLALLMPSVSLTDVPMQKWDPAVSGYNLVLSNYNGIHGIDYRFTQLANGSPIPVLTFQGGNVGIGTVNPDTKLAVLGTIHASAIKVDLSVPQPDYVFDKDYDLASLKDVKTYIDQHHHLPEIPSAAEAARNGINLGEMNTKLLKKVEELTLYLIEKEKKDTEQQQLLSAQQEQLNQLKQQIKLLAQKLK